MNIHTSLLIIHTHITTQKLFGITFIAQVLYVIACIRGHVSIRGHVIVQIKKENMIKKRETAKENMDDYFFLSL